LPHHQNKNPCKRYNVGRVDGRVAEYWWWGKIHNVLKSIYAWLL